MNITLLLGLLIGAGGIFAGYLIEKGVISALWQLSAFCIVFGGTFGIALVANPFKNIKRIPAAMKLIFFHKKQDYSKLTDQLCGIANKARKDGLLSLEAEAEATKDPFIKKGLGYIADGVDPEFLRNMLQNEIDSQIKYYESAAAVFDGMGGTGPTMGVLGTVMGMVTVLGGMGSNMDNIGKEIATAFIATFYGVGSANLLWLPIGSHIKMVALEDADFREIVMEGLLAIQSGESSMRLRDRLNAMIADKKKSASKSKTDKESASE